MNKLRLQREVCLSKITQMPELGFSPWQAELNLLFPGLAESMAVSVGEDGQRRDLKPTLSTRANSAVGATSHIAPPWPSSDYLLWDLKQCNSVLSDSRDRAEPSTSDPKNLFESNQDATTTLMLHF